MKKNTVNGHRIIVNFFFSRCARSINPVDFLRRTMDWSLSQSKLKEQSEISNRNNPNFSKVSLAARGIRHKTWGSLVEAAPLRKKVLQIESAFSKRNRINQ